jgi:hypothetical protein
MPGSSSYSSTARHQAQQILSKPPYRTTPSHTPRPLAGVFHGIGRGLEWAVGHPARWLYHHVLLHIGHGFSGAFGGWWPIALGAIAIAVGVMVGVLLVRRRTRLTDTDVSSGSMRARLEDPDEIEARAVAAEASGDHEAAVRLRFGAGLLRLALQGAIVDYNVQSGRQLSRLLQSPTFDALANRHEVIVYGRDPATTSDAASARDGWPRVLTEVRGQGST